MSVSTTTKRIAYTGNGVQVTFPYPFKIFADGDLQVYIDGTLKTLTTHYTVTGAGDATGGNVVFVTAPGTSSSVVIVRVLATTQLVSYPSNNKFPASVHEGALDRLTMLVQQQEEQLERTPALSISNATVVRPLALPNPLSKGYLRWNTAATGLEAVTAASDIVGVVSDTITESTYAGLPAVGTPGKLRKVTNLIRGLWMDCKYVWARLNGDVVDVKEFGAVWDGSSHPLSSRYASLGAAQVDYPHATSLTEEIDWAAWQGAVNAAAAGAVVQLPDGTGVVSKKVSYTNGAAAAAGIQTRGYGLGRTKIDNRVASDSLIDANGAATLNTFFRGGGFRKFEIMTTTSPAASHGITLKGWWYALLSQIKITGLTGSAIRIKSDDTASAGDYDSCSNVILSQCELRSNTGYGVEWVSANTIVNGGFVCIDNCEIFSNKAGGVKYAGIQGRISNTSISWNGRSVTDAAITNATGDLTSATAAFTTADVGKAVFIDAAGTAGAAYAGIITAYVSATAVTVSPVAGATVSGKKLAIGNGVWAYYNGGAPQTLHVVQCELDSNAAAQVQLDAGYGHVLDCGQMTHQNIASPTGVGFWAPVRGVIVGDGSHVASCRIVNPRVRVNMGSGGSAAEPIYHTTEFEVKANAGPMTTIDDPIWVSFSNGAGTATRYSDAIGVPLRDEGFVFRDAHPSTLPALTGAVAAGGTYTPSMLTATHHRIRVDGATATIAAPTNARDGQLLFLDIYNNSGGATTITFNATYSHAGYTDPANAKRRTAVFYKEPSGSWRLMGAWSPDI